MDELGSFPTKISVRTRMALYRDFRKLLVQEKNYNDFKGTCFGHLRHIPEYFNYFTNFWVGYMRCFLIIVSMPRSPWILLCPFPVDLDCTRQRAIILSKIVHPYVTPIVRETKQSYMATLNPYTDEVQDTFMDPLKANLKGVIVLTSVVQNEEDEILGINNSNQPCKNSFLSGQKNIPSNCKDDNLCERVASLVQSMMEATDLIAIDEDYTTPIEDEDCTAVDVDEIFPLAIVDENLVAVDEYFVEKVNEVVEEMKNGEKEQVEEKMEEKEEDKDEEKLE
ncbi:hypothetical protein H5410_050462 [Solanum commersonii]|uniref:Uncharacterized protein n=1 Tax=Solanum commersonii TaxID=4109 RepID=A0A9J5WVI9_SOLCO|nr:hypothetical protein H5410_050462 [Solanum commersonii]